MQEAVFTFERFTLPEGLVAGALLSIPCPQGERDDFGTASTHLYFGAHDDPRDLRASAGSMPLRDRSVDAAMAILSVHHWDEEREKGVRELRRVARGAVVILTYDAIVSGAMWLIADYLPEVAALDLRIFPPPEQLAEWLGGDVRIAKLPIPRDTPDWMLGSFWAHPERVLDANARAATSGFARMSANVVDRVVADVSRDLASGLWDQRHGHLRNLDELDAGLRLVVATSS